MTQAPENRVHRYAASALIQQCYGPIRHTYWQRRIAPSWTIGAILQGEEDISYVHQCLRKDFEIPEAIQFVQAFLPLIVPIPNSKSFSLSLSIAEVLKHI